MFVLLSSSIYPSDSIETIIDGAGSVSKQSDTNADSDCPVCTRVIRAAKEMAKLREQDVTSALNSYCLLSNIDVSDQKFCYNTENVRGELSRMLNLGADEYRVCKKVKSMNPDFCKVMSKKVNKDGVHKNERLIRGVIYE